MKTTIAILGLLLLILFECARVYLIMPMPGSQNFDSIEIAYFLGSNKWIIRLIGYLTVSVPLVLILRNGVKKEKLIIGGLTAMYLIVFYVFTWGERYLAVLFGRVFGCASSVGSGGHRRRNATADLHPPPLSVVDHHPPSPLSVAGASLPPLPSALASS